jgi:signal transduction histidine kinase
VGDLACIALALFIGGLATDATDVGTGSYAPVNDLVGVTAAVVLLWRRRAPLVVAAVTFVAAAAAPMAAGAAILGVYTVAAYRERRIAVGIVALYMISGVMGIILFPDQDLDALQSALVGLLLTVAAFGWGLAVRRQRQLLVALAGRAERAEAEQHANILEARRTERTRIAAEMHDVLAHRLSMLSLHAGAIEFRPDAKAEDLATAAQVIRSNAHQALEELRGVIGVLRDDTASSDLTPQPSIADLDTLIEECRAAGMHIDFVGQPNVDTVPSELSRHAYRIVQEGLTNARKHAPGQPVHLGLSGGKNEGLLIEITNSTSIDSTKTGVPGAGVGLVGLRERVELVGGTFHVYTDEAGRHRLCARLPWPV